MRRKKQYPEITPSETLVLLDKMNKIINDGYSIVYARKIVCGGPNCRKTRAVMKHDLYLHILNKYLEDRKYWLRFKKVEGQLKQKKAPLTGQDLQE